MTTITPELWVEDLKDWTVRDVLRAVKLMEEKFDISAKPQMVVQQVVDVQAEAIEEQTEFLVMLTGFGDKKVAVIKAVREATGLGLAESKALVDTMPQPVKEGLDREAAEALVGKIVEAGGQAEVQ